MEAKYPRLMFVKKMTACLGYEVDVMKKKKSNDYCRIQLVLGLSLGEIEKTQK